LIAFEDDINPFSILQIYNRYLTLQKIFAPRPGFEPGTYRLTGESSDH
jgi:hypothetical protein